MSSCGLLHLKTARQYYEWAIHMIEGNIHKLAAMFNVHIPTFPSQQQLLSLFYFCLSTSIVKILYLLGFQWFCLTFLIVIQPFHSSLHPTALIVERRRSSQLPQGLSKAAQQLADKYRQEGKKGF